MCTVIILRRPDHPWPVILAANRDEMLDRPWRPPGRHWPERPEVVAGLDELAGGSWLGLNDHGLAAGILNRTGSLGPGPDTRSRGELVLEALDHADAVAAAEALSHVDTKAYRGFNMVLADNRDAFWLRNLGSGNLGSGNLGSEGRGRVDIEEIPEGLSLITARDLNDPASPRIRHYLPLFRAAPAPDPEAGDWSAWEALTAGAAREPG